MVRAALCAFIYSTISACSEQLEVEICWPGGGTPTEGAEVEVGTGQARFEPLVENQSLVLVRGTQGGFHFQIHARMRGMVPGIAGDPSVGNPNTFFQAFTLDGEKVSSRDCEFPFGYAEDDDGFVLPSSRILFIRRDVGESLYGQRVRVQAEMRDPAGRYAVDSRVIIAVEPPETPPGPSTETGSD